MFDLAIYYRMVGGFIGLGSTQLGRLRFALAIAFYMAFVSCVHHEGALQALIVLASVTVLAFAGRLISHSRFQASASFGNSLGMAVINVIRMALIVAPLTCGNWLTLSDWHLERFVLCLFGIGSGIAYYVGWKWLNGTDSCIYWKSGTNYEHCAIGGSEWGELLTGMSYQAMYMCALVMA